MRECGLKSVLAVTSIKKDIVTPCAGVWIEMSLLTSVAGLPESLPVRECGLKLEDGKTGGTLRFVTPCAGVWIEIHNYYTKRYPKYVTPCAGVWIEITLIIAFCACGDRHSLCGSVD